MLDCRTHFRKEVGIVLEDQVLGNAPEGLPGAIPFAQVRDERTVAPLPPGKAAN